MNGFSIFLYWVLLHSSMMYIKNQKKFSKAATSLWSKGCSVPDVGDVCFGADDVADFTPFLSCGGLVGWHSTFATKSCTKKNQLILMLNLFFLENSNKNCVRRAQNDERFHTNLVFVQN